MNQNLQNGVPPQWSPLATTPQKPPPQPPHALNNGLASSQSSRDSSPAARIPATQLPPSRPHVPASQLPPAPKTTSNNLLFQPLTPHSSPRMPTFSTSTPITQSSFVEKRGDVSGPNSMHLGAGVGGGVRPPHLSHAASSPALAQAGAAPAVRQLQPQTVPRPMSSGPQLQMAPQPPGAADQQPQNNGEFPTQKPMQNAIFPMMYNAPVSQFENVTATNVVYKRYPQPPAVQFQANAVSSPPSALPAAPPPLNQFPGTVNQSQNTFNQHPTSSTFNQPPAAFNAAPSKLNQPAVAMNQHPTTFHKPSGNLNQPATAYHQPPISIPQAPPTFNHPPTTIQPPPPPAPFQQPPTTFNQPPGTFNQPPTNFNAPANSFNQPATNFNQQTIAYNQQQACKPSTVTYPPQNYQKRNYQQNITQQMLNLSVTNAGINKCWGMENFDLLQCPNILPPHPVETPRVRLGQEYLDSANCSPDIFRCTMTKIPESNSLLQKSRLPLGVLIHPFKDLNHLPVIQCSTIVRCRACRTYINPFIFFVDSKRWKCNLCYRINELPEEFQYDPVSKSYGDPSRRPEIKSSTIEYIAPSEYMLRPPQPAVYLYLLDVSRLATETGYLHKVCEILASQLVKLPGDTRTQIGFLAFNSTLHFFSLAEGLSQPHELIVSDIDDVFLPCPDNLLVNLKENVELITDLLNQLPTRYQNTFDTGSALGAALQAAFKLMSATGGRVTVFQTCLPTIGPGSLTVREDPNQRAGKEAPHLNPATDFYKRLALDCSAQQIAVDLFILNSQYVDIATLSGISRFSGGCMYHLPLFKASSPPLAERFERCFKRYLTRKIGFEAVMRIRCTRGLAIHTFHGNFFVRSTDLLSLPNVNPDAGFGMQVSIEESLADLQTVCFQAAVLYTSSKGERRIRVHTLCLPVATTLSDVLNAADQQCIVGLLAKMAVDRSLQSSLSDARDAFINAAIDVLSSYKISLNMGNSCSGLMAPGNLKLLPLYILALLKFTAFRTGHSTRLDDRVFAMCEMKTLPLMQLLQLLYPDLYPIHQLPDCTNIVDADGTYVPQLPRLHLSARSVDSNGVYLMDVGEQMLIFVCQNVPATFLIHTLGVPSFNSIPDQSYELPKLDNEDNQRLHTFVSHLNEEKPYPASILILRENSPNRTVFLERLIEDRIESALSYNEFLQHLKTQVK